MCHEEYQDPKILPCTHIVCKKCVLSWLHKNGGQAGCPLCRNEILPSPGRDRGPAQCPESRVDDLPTDLALVALLESSNILKGRGACAICEGGGEAGATSFCLQCDVRLCPACARTHGKYPSFRDHRVQELGSLTPSKLAAGRTSSCEAHPGKPVELFCPLHRHLVCLLCASTTHEACGGKTSIPEAARRERELLLQRVTALRAEEAAITRKVRMGSMSVSLPAN